MRDYSLTHLSDPVLIRDLAELVRQDRVTTSTLLAHIAEVDSRRLYVPAGYPSMHAYCVGALRMSEESASRRIQAARAARKFPVLFTAVAEGSLHLTAVGLLAPHLTGDNVQELVAMATNRSKSEIEVLLARRGAPKVEIHGTVRAVPAECVTQHSLANTDRAIPAQGDLEPAVTEVAPTVEVVERYVVRMTIDRGTHERLRHAQALLSHAVPSGDVGQVFDRALVALITQLELRKFGVGTRVGSRKRVASRSRHIPAPMKKAVWERDGGRCTFVATGGHRCDSTKFLEIDHVEPFARVPEATVEGLRLRCRAHNQYEAERAFGSAFMKRKRDEARIAAERRRREAVETRARAEAANSEVEEQIQDVLAALRSLGIRGEHARHAAEHARALMNATLVDRIRAALQYHGEWIRRSPKMARALAGSSG